MGCKFTTVSFLAWAVRGTTCWCKGTMPVTRGDAVMPGREPTSGVSWTALAVQVLHLTDWGLLLSELLGGGGGGEEPRVQ